MKRFFVLAVSGCLILAGWNNMAVAAADLSEIPYLFKITDPDYPLYDGPGYGYDNAGTVKEAGVYTIIEEARDEDDDLWGKLKSGAGWVNLTDTGVLEPISVDYAEEALLNSEDTYHKFTAEDSEYTSWIAFEAKEILENVNIEVLQYNEETYEVDEVLYELTELTPEKPLVAGVVYYGDMTTYGISFKDSNENMYHYAVYMSGKDGSILLEKYTPMERDLKEKEVE